MLLTAVYLSLLIAALARTGSAAAIDSGLRTRAKWPSNINLPGWASGAVNSVQGAVQNLPGAVGGLVANAENCPKIIQLTDWDKHLGVAPIAAATNKACPWKSFAMQRPRADYLSAHKGTMEDVWGVVKCGGNCLLAFVQEDLNALQDTQCARCLGQSVMDNLPCIKAVGGFQTICTKAAAIPGFGPCLTGTADTPGICPKRPANPRIAGTS